MTSRTTRSRRTTADGLTIADIAIGHTEKALTALTGIIDRAESSDAAKVSAANAILDRAWGRPGQFVDEPNDGDDDLAALLTAARQRVLQGREP
jgi:thioredoxin-like negative regulator of GroEL